MEKDKFLKLIEQLEDMKDKDIQDLYAEIYTRAIKKADYDAFIQSRMLIHAMCLIKDIKKAEEMFKIRLLLANGYSPKEIAEKFMLPLNNVIDYYEKALAGNSLLKTLSA